MFSLLGLGRPCARVRVTACTDQPASGPGRPLPKPGPTTRTARRRVLTINRVMGSPLGGFRRRGGALHHERPAPIAYPLPDVTLVVAPRPPAHLPARRAGRWWLRPRLARIVHGRQGRGPGPRPAPGAPRTPR